MKITKNEIKYVAKLARIDIEKDKEDSFTKDMQKIIEYIDKLNEIETKEDVKDENMSGKEIFLRDDVKEKSYNKKDIIMNAPTHDDKYIIVPNIVE